MTASADTLAAQATHPCAATKHHAPVGSSAQGEVFRCTAVQPEGPANVSSPPCARPTDCQRSQALHWPTPPAQRLQLWPPAAEASARCPRHSPRRPRQCRSHARHHPAQAPPAQRHGLTQRRSRCQVWPPSGQPARRTVFLAPARGQQLVGRRNTLAAVMSGRAPQSSHTKHCPDQRYDHLFPPPAQQWQPPAPGLCECSIGCRPCRRSQDGNGPSQAAADQGP